MFGIRRFLIGESLMKRPDRAAFTAELRQAT
jgi:indole-3-glycerol phosphate synthase